MTGAPDGYLDSTHADVSRLSEDLARLAKVRDWGEAEWPPEMAEAAVRALVGLGRTVNLLGWTRVVEGELVDLLNQSTYEGWDPEANLRYILTGLPALEGARTAIVCWYPEGADYYRH